MALTIFQFLTNLERITEKQITKIYFYDFQEKLNCPETYNTLKAIIDRCNQFLDGGSVINDAEHTLSLMDTVRIIRAPDSKDGIKIQLKHYGVWCDAPNPKDVLSHFNVLNHRETLNFTRSDSNLIYTIVLIAIKDFFYPEVPEEFPQFVIQRKLQTKAKRKTLFDFELHGYKDQEFLISRLIEAVSNIWESYEEEERGFFKYHVMDFGVKIKTDFENILDGELVDLISVIPKTSDLVGYYDLYNNFAPYKASLIKWKSESSQRLAYVLLNTEQGLSPDDSNYFSYSNLLDINSHRTFLDKVSVRRLLQSDISILYQILSCTPKNYNNYQGFFSLWSFWLGHTKHQYIHSDVFMVLTSFELHLHFDKSNPNHLKTFRKHGIPLLDLLYGFLLAQYERYATHGQAVSLFSRSILFNESYDYFNVSELPFELRQERRETITMLNEINDFILYTGNANIADDFAYPNLIRVNPQTNMGSLSRNAHIWHNQVLQREKGPLSAWTQFKPFSAVIEGYTFTLLTDNHMLFEEGLEMQHCVSTFESRICSDIYLVFKLQGENERGTVGLLLTKDESSLSKFKIHQIRGVANAELSECARTHTEQLTKMINTNPNLIYVSGRLPNVVEIEDIAHEVF